MGGVLLKLGEDGFEHMSTNGSKTSRGGDDD